MDKKITSLLLVSIVTVSILITLALLGVMKLDSKLFQKKSEDPSLSTNTSPQTKEEIVLEEASDSGDIDDEQGVVTTDWDVLVELIEACEATSITQTHAKEVRITTKEGFILRSTEPKIDDIFEVYNRAQGTCGSIPIATE